MQKALEEAKKGFSEGEVPVGAVLTLDNKIIAKEDNRGTKKMMSELKNNSGGILIKFPKKKQDLRIDLPTIGIQTIKDCKKYGLKGIVLKSLSSISSTSYNPPITSGKVYCLISPQ